MKATVVIPNYNGLKFLKPCLESLKRQTEQDFALIIIDNASTDGSIEFIKEEYSSIKLILNQENLGFSKAVNQGIAATKTPYVILLNNDTKIKQTLIKLYINIPNRFNLYLLHPSSVLIYHSPFQLNHMDILL